MPKRSSKKMDMNVLAKSVVDQATEPEPVIKVAAKKAKNAAAVELGRLGGLKGGKARAQKLSAAKRSEIAKKAAKARWGKSKR